MDQEILSICIPTYNRSHLLKQMLSVLDGQIRATDADRVAIYISDNASPDATQQVVEEFQKHSAVKLVYSRNPANIGLSNNLLKVMGMGKGRFIWTLGDDELIAPDAVPGLVKALRRHDPGLVLMFDTRYKLPLPKPGLYSDYCEFARACIKLDNVHALAEHTLLSSNLYRADYFDLPFGQANIDTWFPHMFGFLRPLLKARLPVLVADFPVISTREEDRGVPSDGQWANLDQCWATYLKWLRDEMRMPELDPLGAGRAARRQMLQNIRSHPIAYLRRNWRALFQPSAYRFVFTRLFGLSK